VVRKKVDAGEVPVFLFVSLTSPIGAGTALVGSPFPFLREHGKKDQVKVQGETKKKKKQAKKITTKGTTLIYT